MVWWIRPLQRSSSRYPAVISSPAHESKKTNQLQFEKFLDKIIKTGAIDVKIVENFGIDDEEVDFSKDEGEDTLTILNKYIEDSDFELSKEIVKNLMKEVYQQACELD